MPATAAGLPHTVSTHPAGSVGTYEVGAEEAEEHEDGQHAKCHGEALVVLQVTKGKHTQDGTCLAAGS